MEVRCAEALQQLCQTQANITQLPIDPAKSVVIMENPETVVVNKKFECIFTLHPRIFNSRVTKRKCVVDCDMKCLCTGTIG